MLAELEPCKWHACQSRCALFVEDPEMALAEFLLLPREEWSSNSISQLVQPCPEEVVHDGRVVVWTDGAGRRNQDSRTRRAGIGVFYSESHMGNVSRPLPGMEQTNNRAELHAIIDTVERDRRPLEIRTDSKYCVTGLERLSALVPKENADLWARLKAAMAGADVLVTKVKGLSLIHISEPTRPY